MHARPQTPSLLIPYSYTATWDYIAPEILSRAGLKICKHSSCLIISCFVVSSMKSEKNTGLNCQFQIDANFIGSSRSDCSFLFLKKTTFPVTVALIGLLGAREKNSANGSRALIFAHAHLYLSDS